MEYCACYVIMQKIFVVEESYYALRFFMKRFVLQKKQCRNVAVCLISLPPVCRSLTKDVNRTI